VGNATVAPDISQLRLLRKRARLSQQDLAARVGTTRQAISLIERGLRSPRPSTAAALLAAVLNGR
jgi:transcriptional regulator with XRE-family HTH domain